VISPLQNAPVMTSYIYSTVSVIPGKINWNHFSKVLLTLPSLCSECLPAVLTKILSRRFLVFETSGSYMGTLCKNTDTCFLSKSSLTDNAVWTGTTHLPSQMWWMYCHKHLKTWKGGLPCWLFVLEEQVHDGILTYFEICNFFV